jgi:hypothetical protein
MPVLALVSCGPATKTPQPLVDYKTIPPNPAFTSPVAGASAATQDSPATGDPGSGVIQPSMPAEGAAGMTGGTLPPMAATASAAGTAAIAPVAGTSAMSQAGGNGGTMAMATPQAGAPGMAEQPPAAKPTTLTLDFMTKTQRGRYAPKNVGAAWVETTNGKWVHTLEYWAGKPNDAHLTRYNAAGGPNYATNGELARVLGLPPYTTKPPADVVAGPTLDMHKLHSGSMWNLKDATGKEVADGMYRVVIELTEVDSTGKSQEIPFVKGAMPVSLMMDYEFYSGVKLTLK